MLRRAIALTAVTALALSAAGAATAAAGWTKYADVAANGASWSYKDDYTYKDRATGRLVVMQAISKGAMGPNGPGASDGVGSVVAVDCGKKNLISLGAYKPGATFETKSNWRNDTPKKADGAENVALVAAICAHADHVPVK